MAGLCCRKPIARIIKVANFEAGITGLEEAMKCVRASGIKDETWLKAELLRLVETSGNYITPGTEDDYKNALFREYQTFILRDAQKK